MNPAAVILAIALSACLVDCPAQAATPATVCAPHRDVIRDAADVSGVPFALLMALVFAESTCRADAVNKRTGAIGLGQLLLTGAGAGYTANELRDPWLNALLSARYLAKWRKRCGSWRGAVAIYHGRGLCSAKSRHADRVIRIWKQIERMEEPRS